METTTQEVTAAKPCWTCGIATDDAFRICPPCKVAADKRLTRAAKLLRRLGQTETHEQVTLIAAGDRAAARLRSAAQV